MLVDTCSLTRLLVDAGEARDDAAIRLDDGRAGGGPETGTTSTTDQDRRCFR
jgi:hypothetical protein